MDFKEFQNKYEEKMNKLKKYCFTAYNNKEYNEKITTLNLSPENIVSIGNNCFTTKEISNKIIDITNEYESIKIELMKDNNFLYDLFYHTMITTNYVEDRDYLDLLYNVGIISNLDMINDKKALKEFKNFDSNKRMKNIFNKAEIGYLSKFNYE